MLNTDDQVFDNVFDFLESSQAWTMIRPSVFSSRRFRILDIKGVDGYIEIDATDKIEFTLRMVLGLSHTNNRFNNSTQYYPYSYSVEGFYNKHGVVVFTKFYSSLLNPNSMTRYEVDTERSNVKNFTADLIIDRIDSGLNNSYNQLSPEEKSVHILTHGEVPTKKVEYQIQRLDRSMAHLLSKVRKRKRKITCVRLLIGQWLEPKQGDSAFKALMIILFNAAAIYNISKVVTGLLILLL